MFHANLKFQVRNSPKFVEFEPLLNRMETCETGKETVFFLVMLKTVGWVHSRQLRDINK